MRRIRVTIRLIGHSGWHEPSPVKRPRPHPRPRHATARPTRAPYSSNGFPLPTQASKPPAMLLTFEYPIRCRVSAASAERAPLRQ